MKPLLLLLCFITAQSSNAQLSITQDSLPHPIDVWPVPGYEIPFRFNSREINTDSAYALFHKVLPGILPAQPDFNKTTYYYIAARGDCHARFSYHAFSLQQEKRIVIVETDIYGGCRSTTVKTFLLIIPKPAADWQLRFRHVYVDR